MRNKTKRRLYRVISLLVCMLMVVMNIHIVQVHAAEKSYQYCQTKTEKGVTFKVEWDEPKLGEETVFHLSATGGNASNKYFMTSPNYSNPGSTEREMLVDPTYSEWKNYTKECSTYDLKFKMTASGTYYFRFYVMNMSSPVVYFSIDVTISVSDADHPSVDSVVKSAVAQCNRETTGSDYDRALWLHDWLNAQIEYDNMHAWCSAEGALTRGLGTCEGYQRAYAKLLTAAGIPNERIEDRADNHTWNAVKLDGEWYQVDCTWDDTSEHWYDFDQRYMYFGLTDELMAIAHPHHADLYTTSGYQARSTSLANNYLVRNGDAAKWAEAYRARIQAKLGARETTFTIAADNSSYPPSYSGILNGITAYAINQMNWSYGNLDVSLQATGSATQFAFQVSYAEEHMEHRWDAGTVTKAATCTQKGIRTYRCTAAGCKQTRTEELPALGHSMTRVVSERVAPKSFSEQTAVSPATGITSNGRNWKLSASNVLIQGEDGTQAVVAVDAPDAFQYDGKSLSFELDGATYIVRMVNDTYEGGAQYAKEVTSETVTVSGMRSVGNGQVLVVVGTRPASDAQDVNDAVQTVVSSVLESAAPASDAGVVTFNGVSVSTDGYDVSFSNSEAVLKTGDSEVKFTPSSYQADAIEFGDAGTSASGAAVTHGDYADANGTEAYLIESDDGNVMAFTNSSDMLTAVLGLQ